MRLKLTTTLLVLLIVVGGVDGTVRTLRAQDARKPTPTPTPPTGGPVPTDPGGPSRNATGDRGGARGFNERRRIGVGERAGASETKPASRRASDDDYKVYERAPRTRARSYNRRPGALRPYCDRDEQEQEDLTGKYSGTLIFPGRDLSGPADLLIEGRKFSFVSGDHVLSGTIASTTTCNYTAIALRFEAPSSADVPKTISLEARRVGSGLILTAVPGETKIEFTPVPNARRH